MRNTDSTGGLRGEKNKKMNTGVDLKSFLHLHMRAGKCLYIGGLRGRLRRAGGARTFTEPSQFL